MPDFNNTIIIGKQREKEICEIIQKKYPKAYVIPGYCKGYDIYVPETNIHVEVKQDYKSHYTDNFLIEIEFDNIPSGLSTTIADWWVLVDKDYFIWVTPDVLRLLIREGNMRPATFIGKGDTKVKKAYLIKKDIILVSPYVKTVKRG